jgi:hypothetical protein
VELNALPRGDTQGVVAVVCRQIIERDPLGRGHHAARDAPADHHDVFLALFAQVPVVLLVNAMELEELLVIGRELIGRLIRQCPGNVTRQRRDGILDDLVMRPVLFSRCNHK